MKKKAKNSSIIKDPSMDKYNGPILLSEKIARVNEKIKKYGLPKIEDLKKL